MKIRNVRLNIDVTGADLTQIVSDVFDRLEDVNEKEPTLFSQNGRLVICEIAESPNGESIRQVSNMDHPNLRTWLSFHFDFTKTPAPTRMNPQPGPLPWIPSRELLDALINAGEWRGIPELRDVSSLPIITQYGEVVQQRGYHPSTQVYMGPIVPYADHELLMDPPQSHVDRAKELLLTEVLGDFEWRDEEDRANALAAILTAATRYMYDCPLPLYIFDSTNPQSGKGTLAGVTAAMWGSSGATETMPDDEDEFRKRVIPALTSADKVIVFDNVEHKLGGPTLNALLTSTIFKDRILGSSRTVQLPNNKLWCVTGNNIKLGRDMPRRCVKVTQDPKKNPAERHAADFRHPNLIGWVKEKQRGLQWASLTCVLRWVADGMPLATHLDMGNMTPWAQTMGGVLGSIGVEGFLRNPIKDDGLDEDTLELYEFLEAITPYVGQNTFRARDLADILNGALGPNPSQFIAESLPPKVRRVHMNNGAVHKSLGWYLESVAGRFAGLTGVRVKKAETWTARDKTYTLERPDWDSLAAISQNTRV